MEFLGIGPAELIVILVVALVFVGPERLPKLAADIARTIREIRKYTGSIAAEFSEVIQDFEKETHGEKTAWKEIGEGLTGAAKSITDAVRDARAEAQGAPVVDVPTPAATGDAVTAATPPDAPAPTAWVDIPATPPGADSPAGQAPNGSGSLASPPAQPAEEPR